MTQEMLLSYEKEVRYQKHMLDNLGRWFTLLFAVAGSGVVLIYFFYETVLALCVLGAVLMIVGVLGMLLFGYGIYKGRANLAKFIQFVESNLADQ